MKEKLTRLYLIPYEMKEKLYKSLDGYEEKMVENINTSGTQLNIPTKERMEVQKPMKKQRLDTLDSYPNLLTGKK